jgi:AcrR family transcriptional regulator
VTGTRRPRTGRRPGAGDTRGYILAAARTAFGERGFEGTTIRDVAARSGVDPALVHHYFGTKQQLFLAAMQIPVDLPSLVPQILAGPRHEIGARFVRSVLREWDAPATRPTILGIVRSATTDPVAAGMLRRMLAEGPILSLADALDRPDARLRATLAGSQLIGLVMARYVVGVEPLASAPAELVVRTIGPVIQGYLVGDLETLDSASGDA